MCLKAAADDILQSNIGLLHRAIYEFLFEYQISLFHNRKFRAVLFRPALCASLERTTPPPVCARINQQQLQTLNLGPHEEHTQNTRELLLSCIWNPARREMDPARREIQTA
jgi:hypothetical protein